MEEDKEIIILDKNIKLEDYQINDDGSYRLLFETIIKEQNIKILIRSNEKTNHHRPHVHAFYNNKEYQISIDDNYEELNGKKDKYCNYIIKNYLIENLQKCRKVWNEIDSMYKFNVDSNGLFMCK